MRTVRILALHLAYGGIEKAVIGMANLFAESRPVEIISVYRLPDAPAFPLDPRVKVRYLLEDRPNREEWKAALRAHAPLGFLKESFRAVRTLRRKKRAVLETIRSIRDGVLITTRHEDNLVLSRYGDKQVLKIAQLHHDHGFDKRYLRDFRQSYGGIDVLTLLTPGLVEELREIIPAERCPRLVCVPNFLERFPEQVELERKEHVLLSVGRLDPVKGFDRLIRCFAKIHERRPEWTLRLVGEGSERAKLETLIREYGLEGAVCLTGRLDAAGVEAEMRRASLYAMASHSEGFGIVLIEAQSCGLPVVAFDVRVGPAAVVTDGLDGYLVPDRDEERYTERLLELMEREDLRREMALRAMEQVRRFSRENVARIWDDILGEE